MFSCDSFPPPRPFPPHCVCELHAHSLRPGAMATAGGQPLQRALAVWHECGAYPADKEHLLAVVAEVAALTPSSTAHGAHACLFIGTVLARAKQFFAGACWLVEALRDGALLSEFDMRVADEVEALQVGHMNTWNEPLEACLHHRSDAASRIALTLRLLPMW